MYSGRVVEQGTLDEIFYDPQHPYTWGLLGSITRIDRDRSLRLPAIPGLPPSLLRAAGGLPLPARAARTRSTVAREVPELSTACPTTPDHLDRCWLRSPSRSAVCGSSATRSGWPAREPETVA